MRATVDRILNEKFDYEKGTLEFSTPRIELSLAPGEVYTGSFFISGQAGRLCEGHLYSKDIRLKLITDSFLGTGSEIGYSFSAMGLEEGDVVQGDIYIISNQGEYYIPYVITILHKSIATSLGGIKNLFHFTNLAKSNWDEAVKLFYSDEFLSVFTGNDLQYKKVYLGLSRFYGNEQNVEEFLLAINKKQPIEYIPEQTTLTLDNPEGIVEEYVNITRNGWGYTELHAKTDCDFISFPKAAISDNDFLGNYLSFPVRINSNLLHGGTNYGTVILYNSFVTFSINVVINADVITKSDLSRHLEYKRLQIDMMTYYEAFRTKKISVDTWITETEHIVDRMQQIEDKRLTPALFKAQLLMAKDRYNEAKWILDRAESKFNERNDHSFAVWGYYLYLTTLYTREEAYINSITREVSNLYLNDQSEWRLAWLLLYLSEDFALSPSKKWLFIEQQIETGCISPMFYVEAINMLIANPGLLNRLTDFELRVLRYGVKKDLLTPEIITQFTYLAAKEKKFTKEVYDILRRCYEIAPFDDLVEVICELLIKGDIHNDESYEWYLLALNKELRITNLYEYFIQSMDLSKEYEIPRMVYLYFSYESELDWEHTAYLYSHAINDRESMPDTFDTYKERISDFAVNEILKGHMNKDMAIIYRYVLSDIVLTSEIAKMLSKLLFVHRISVDRDDLTKAVVYQSRECVESVYSVEKGTAYVPLYNKDFTILFEDGLSNRYAKSVEYDLEKLMVPGKLAARILQQINDNLEFDVYACECSSEMIEINEETRERYQRILEAPEIDSEYKAEVRSNLVKFYYENDAIRELDAILDNLEPSEMSQRERVQAIRFMVVRGMYDKAIDWVIRYGEEGVELKDLVKLCSKLILRNEYAESEALTKIAASIFFKGKYDEVILKYLVSNFHGMTKDMRRIFKAAENFDVDIYSMCENMILQMLYTGYYVSERMDIYRKYVQGGANSDIQSAFLAQCAFEYFVKEQLMEEYVFEELTKQKLRGEPIQTVCKLAYLKFYSEEEKELNETVKSILKEYLDDLISKGIYMSFFKNFMENTTAGVNRFTDKTIIEYKTEPGRRVFIHYIIEDDSEVPGEYVTEEMTDMYGGVHAKSFILFFGESLLYYITEETEGEELLTESASIQKSDISREISNSRFDRVNDIVIAKTLQDYDTVNKLIYDYEKHSYIVKRMFTLQ